MRTLSASRLKHRVTLQAPTGTRDGYGERVTTWTDIATVWAAVEPLSVRDTLAAQQINSEITHRVTIRYSAATFAALGPECRVKLGSRYLPLVGPPRNLEEANVVIELLCSEGMREE